MFRNLYLTHCFFVAIGGCIATFVLAFFIPTLLAWAYGLLVIFGIICLYQYAQLFLTKEEIQAQRSLPKRFSLSDQNTVKIWFQSTYSFKIDILFIDELPFHFQERHFEVWFYKFRQGKSHTSYLLTPKERGIHTFGKLNAYVSFSFLSFLRRRFVFSQEEQQVAVYPSFIQMKKYQNLAFAHFLLQGGLKRIRRVGHSMEFDHISEYVLGDDIRSLNWKATSKHSKLMVNVFDEEKSQQIYSIIDKGRVMQQPFQGLSLLDYAVNSSLAISNIVIKKHDKAGLLTFSNTVQDIAPANNNATQMQLIMQRLYNISTSFQETNFEVLYTHIRKHITQRALLMLYTNFTTLESLQRQLPYLKAIAQRHLLVVILFKNTQLQELISAPTTTLHKMYDKAVAQQFETEKLIIIQELAKHGIQHILTIPEALSIEVINKYLEIKKRSIL